ncbi:MAG TPA: flagellar hook-length control protein FliK, partial [Gammaproteobacteria bacterium]|nr:flagellar hook-length control protein FliK [Gammaproteobacteria bacterium]
MAEAAFITPTAEMLAPTPGTPVASAPAVAEGIFAGMLAQRLQPVAEPQAKAAAVGAPKPSPLPTKGLLPGQPSPQDGNLLPPQGLTPVVSDAGAETPIPGLPLPLMAELSPNAGRDGMPQLTAQPDVLAEDLPVAETVADAMAPLPAVLTSPLDSRPQAPRVGKAGPAAGDGRGAPPPVVPVLPGLAATQTVPLTDPRQRPASLGLNARGEAAEMLRGSVASLSAEQAARGGTAAQITNQTLAGDALSRQFQQQIDRLLATSRGPAGSGLSAPLPAATDSTTTLTPPDLAGGAFVLPGVGGEARAVMPAGLAALPTPVVNTGVGHPGWSAELGQRMVWLANQEIREAKIQLNPRHLGPIDVRIVYSDAQQLSVSFNAQNPAAREALDAALPRLREMFEQQGLNLADA